MCIQDGIYNAMPKDLLLSSNTTEHMMTTHIGCKCTTCAYPESEFWQCNTGRHTIGLIIPSLSLDLYCLIKLVCISLLTSFLNKN